MSLPRRLIRTIFTFLHGFRRALWKVTGSGREGVHGMPLTAQGKVVLVRLTYSPGWRLPGGGRKRMETPEDAMLRELREEIGLLGYGSLERIEGGLPGDRSSFFVIRDVVYRPRWSLEIEQVREFDPDRLPDDTTRWTAAILARRPALADPKPPAAPAAGGRGSRQGR